MKELEYEILGHLATGGMAELFLARGRDDGARVVVKRILPEQARDRRFVSMFLDEARVASRLVHPNIARVVDVGRAGSSYFYTMEYVHGRNLREVLTRLVELDHQCPLEVALWVLRGAAAGLHAAHEQRDRQGRPMGIVHRDVSPSNLMVGFDGVVKVVDFGVATAVDRMSDTQSGAVKGKVGYLSPEQCKLRPTDRRSDVFALGIVAYELLTRSRLYRRESDYESMHAIVNVPAPPPSRMRRDLPAELDGVIARALAKDPERRYATAAELDAALAAVQRRLYIAHRPSATVEVMRALFGVCPEPWAELEAAHADTGQMSLAVQAGSDDRPTDPEAPAIDRAIEAMRGVRPPVWNLADERRPTIPMHRAPVVARAPDPEPPVIEVVHEPPSAPISAPMPIAYLSDSPSQPGFMMSPIGGVPNRVGWALEPAEAPRSRAFGILIGAAIGGVAIAAVLWGGGQLEGRSAPVTVAAKPMAAPAAAPAAAMPEPSPPAPVPAPAATPDAMTPTILADDPLAGCRARAQEDAQKGAWADAYDECRNGLRIERHDLELLTVCGLAACALGKADAARELVAVLPADRAALVQARCQAATAPNP